MTTEPNTSMTTERAIEVLTNIVWVEGDLIGSQALSVLTQEIERLTNAIGQIAASEPCLKEALAVIATAPHVPPDGIGPEGATAHRYVPGHPMGCPVCNALEDAVNTLWPKDAP